MKAAVFNAAGQPLTIESVDDPTPGEREVVIQVGACGICGTDLHWTETHGTEGGWRPLARGGILGHEFAGEIVEVGAAARQQFHPGDLVCALPFIGCGTCDACRKGRVFRCQRVETRGSPALPGAYAEFARVGLAEAVRLPAGVGARTGALVEPLAVGLAAAERARFEPGASILIMGAGPVGLAVSLWCRFLGARHVVVSDLVGERAERAAEFGATEAIDAGRESVRERMRSIAGGRPDVVFECVGLPGTLQLAIDEVADDGCVVVAGLCMRPDTFKPAVALVKAIDLRFTMCYEKHHFERIATLLGEGEIDPANLVTDTVGMHAFPARFEALKQTGSDLKVVLEPHRD
ncbi:MAG: alcohol dehydrogenase catalytic domain-containing protein [Pseudomonadota bacterium]